ncbi:MAG: glutathione S-transferase [Burkholderiales bacterium]|jgi:glutathione S-transferase|nr:glutathione S-transferase [Burkholderiales bacterium]
MLHLHYYPGNASLTPHMLLEEFGVQYQLDLVDRTKGAHKSPGYLKLNPNGLIPVLIDADLVLYEAAAICLHLVDVHPKAGLAPALGTPERAHFYKRLIWLTNTLQAMLIHYFYPERLVDDSNAEGAAQVRAHAEAKIGTMLDQLDAELARHGQPWLLGANYSAVDPYALMLCRWTRGMKRPARALPHLAPYLQRVLDRPAVQRAFEQEGLTKPWV